MRSSVPAHKAGCFGSSCTCLYAEIPQTAQTSVQGPFRSDLVCCTGLSSWGCSGESDRHVGLRSGGAAGEKILAQTKITINISI